MKCQSDTSYKFTHHIVQKKTNSTQYVQRMLHGVLLTDHINKLQSIQNDLNH